MSLIIYSKIKEAIENRKKVVLCIVTETKGSTPRKIGSKMLVHENGDVVGSIGGGELEYFVVQKAIENINLKIPKVYSFGLKADFEMACGGNVSVYMESINLPEQLIIFGAGHIGKSLASLAHKINFDITIVDERPDIFNTWNVDYKVNFINKHFSEAVENLIFDKDTYVCSATHAHAHDKEIAEIIIKKEIAYLGIIASKNKALKIRNYLISKGISEENADKIDMPMGLPISCETPDEIAISIIAKIIDERNK